MAHKDSRITERAQKADSESIELELKHWNNRARIHGESIYLELLFNRKLWQQSSAPLQDLAIQAAAKSLPEDYEHLETRSYSEGETHRIATFQNVKTKLILHLVPGDTYLMGSDKNDREGPIHEVTVKPFFIGRTVVSQYNWDQHPHPDFRSVNKPELPIEGVSWVDIQGWLRDTEAGLRLPTEAEWEYACRSGSTTNYFWGPNINHSYLEIESREDGLHWIPELQSTEKAYDDVLWNAFGLTNLLGNVHEWCQDLYRPAYVESPQSREAARGFTKPRRVLRGGSLRSDKDDCRCASRFGYDETEALNLFGFRVARSLSNVPVSMTS